MAQHDYVVANQGFPAFRSDLNDALAAIVSNNSGATEPTTMFAHQMWVDTAANPSILKIRNADNDAWITIGSIDQTGDTFTLVNLRTSGPVVFNDAGADVDFRVESDTDANAFFVEGSSGNVGIGTSSPSRELVVQRSGGTSIFAERTATSPGFVGLYATDLPAVAWNSSGSLRFATIDDVSGFTNFAERMRITSAGYSKASNSGSYRSAIGNYHEFNQNASDATLVLNSTNASLAAEILFMGAARNTSNNSFYAINYYNDGASAYKFQVADSGNVTNTNNSYGAISDVKLKQDIVDAGSQWDDIKGLRIRKFRWKSDPDGFMQMGLVAQEAEEVSPGLIDEHHDYEEVEVPVLDDEGNAVLNEDGTPQVTKERNALGTTTKAVKYSVLYMKAVKALQEAMERIETLEAKVAALEAK